MFRPQFNARNQITAFLAIASLAGIASADFQYPQRISQPKGVGFLDTLTGDNQAVFFGDWDSTTSINFVTPNISGLATAFVHPSSFGGNISIAPGSQAAAGLGSFSAIAPFGVSVPEPTDVLFEWDLASFTGDIDIDETLTEISILNAETTESIFTAPYGTAGSRIVTLEPGLFYRFIVRLAITIDNPDESADFFGSFTIIPAPGIISVFGMTGFAIARRRRA